MYCIVDLHAVTVWQNPNNLKSNIINDINYTITNYFFNHGFINNFNINLKNLFLLIETKSDKSKSLYLSLRKTKKNNLAILEQRFKNLERLLENSNLKKIFDRGFAYVENHDGKKVNKLEKLIQKKSVKLKFIDGIAEALILNKNNKG